MRNIYLKDRFEIKYCRMINLTICRKGGNEWYKNKRQSVEDKKHAKKIMDDQLLELKIMEEIEVIDKIDEIEEEFEFNSFFEEVLSKFPKKYSTIILNTYDKTRVQAEKVLADSKTQF